MPVFAISDPLAIVAGVIAGAVAYVPFLVVLEPVLNHRQNADMLKGMFGEAFRMFLLGEAIGFVVFMAICSYRVVKALRDPQEVER